MKKFSLVILLCCLFSFTFAQTNDIVVYTEKGELFTLYVNSVKQNDPPEANVRARNITGDSYTVRVQFADPAIPELTQKYWTEEKNVDITMIVRQNNKGKWTIWPNGETPRTYETQVVVHNVPPPPHGQHQNNTVSMHVNDGGEHVNLNMNVTEGSMNIHAGAGHESVNVNMSVNANSNVSTTVTTTSTVHGTPHPGAHIPPPASRCQYPMSSADFKQAMNTIQSESFESTKITLAKQVCKSSCMTTEQLRLVIKAFTYEASRLEIAKYAYDYVFDPEKYYLINDAFEYSSSVDELNRFLEPR